MTTNRKEYMRQYMRNYYKKHPDKMIDYVRKWQKRNRLKVQRYNSVYNNSPKQRAKNKKYYETHKRDRINYQKRYVEKNRVGINNYAWYYMNTHPDKRHAQILSVIRWKKKNPELVSLYNKRYRSKHSV